MHDVPSEPVIPVAPAAMIGSLTLSTTDATGLVPREIPKKRVENMPIVVAGRKHKKEGDKEWQRDYRG